MQFISFWFLLFFALYFLLSLRVPHRVWLVITLIFSSVFYGYWNVKFLLLLYYVIVSSWGFGRLIGHTTEDKKRRQYVTLAVINSLIVLGVFKYFDFFATNISAVLDMFYIHFSKSTYNIVLPIGISFYTFHALSYIIDIYRRELKRPADLLSVAVYLSFFPQLVAGPIVRAHRFLPQIRRGPQISARKIKTALLLIAWGYFLKIAVADNIGLRADKLFMQPDLHPPVEILFCMFTYAFQIYSDFAGYSLIAIGLAKMLGFDFPINFRAPYFSCNVADFWRRWNMSLSYFLRDYLYIPLGGNRRGVIRTYLNLFLTMALCGLWHGASWNFVLWGVFHGVCLIINRIWRLHPRWHLTAPRSAFGTYLRAGFSMLITFVLVDFAWLIFRLQDTHLLAQALRGLLPLPGHPGEIELQFIAVKLSLMIAITIAVDAAFLNRRRLIRLLRSRWGYSVAVAVPLILIQTFGCFRGSTFIYFQF